MLLLKFASKRDGVETSKNNLQQFYNSKIPISKYVSVKFIKTCFITCLVGEGQVNFLALLSRDFFLVKLPLCFVYYSYRVAVCQNKRTLCTVLKALLGQPSEPKASWLPEFPFDVKKKTLKRQITNFLLW